jgi:hypothetical protein
MGDSWEQWTGLSTLNAGHFYGLTPQTYDANVARPFPYSCGQHYGRARRNATMTAWQSGYKVRRERGYLAKALRCQFGHSYGNNLARNRYWLNEPGKFNF